MLRSDKHTVNVRFGKYSPKIVNGRKDLQIEFKYYYYPVPYKLPPFSNNGLIFFIITESNSTGGA